MLRIIDKEGKVLSEFLLSSCVDVDVSCSRCVLESLRGAVGPVFARHPPINRNWHLFNSRSAEMDLQREYIKQNGLATTPELKKLLIAPAAEILPDDGILEYVQVVSVYDLKSLPPQAVAMFASDANELVKLISEHPSVFGVEPRVLAGIPGVEYTPDFDAASWNVEKVAYSPFISEIRLGQDIQERIAQESASLYDKERAQVERADGTVKPHDADIADEDSVSDD